LPTPPLDLAVEADAGVVITLLATPLEIAR
jgi:hypothetical protein